MGTEVTNKVKLVENYSGPPIRIGAPNEKKIEVDFLAGKILGKVVIMFFGIDVEEVFYEFTYIANAFY